jgi:hypothetical protein
MSQLLKELKAEYAMKTKMDLRRPDKPDNTMHHQGSLHSGKCGRNER